MLDLSQQDIFLLEASPHRRDGRECGRRGLRHSKIERDPSVVGEPLPRLFSPITVEKRFDAAAIVAVLPHPTDISPLCSG